MKEVLESLEMKNHYYEKFLSTTLKLLNQARNNVWDELEFYVDNRERILNIIRSYDHKISEQMSEKEVSASDKDRYKHQVQALLDTRAILAKKIVDADLELISRIDEMKMDTIKELKQNIETEQHFSTFNKNGNTKKSSKRAA